MIPFWYEEYRQYSIHDMELIQINIKKFQMKRNTQKIPKSSKLFTQKKYKCQYCRDTGWVYQILNYSDMTIDPGSEPIYEKVPCEDCGIE